MNKTNERFHNLAHLFTTLRLEGATTQADLKEKLGLQASTISYLVNDLRSKGLIQNSNKNITAPKVGKPGQPIELNNEYAHFLGLYLEETFVDVHIIGIADIEIYSERISLIQGPPEEVLTQVISLVNDLLSRYDNIRGIGIAVKSVVDSEGNISSFKRTLIGSEGPRIWSIHGFTKTMRQEFPNLHIVVENDANCAATYSQAETKHIYANSMTIIVNTEPFGIGCGLIINDRLFTGSHGAAGEIFFSDRTLQNLIEQQKNGNAPVQIMKLLKESIIKGLYMIDPQKVYLSGSLLSHIDTATRDEILELFEQAPYDLEILIETPYSLPAKGAVLLAVDAYVMDLLAMLDRR
jgi:predicted NBD/HSP70 family sugar kinase